MTLPNCSRSKKNFFLRFLPILPMVTSHKIFYYDFYLFPGICFNLNRFIPLCDCWCFSGIFNECQCDADFLKMAVAILSVNLKKCFYVKYLTAVPPNTRECRILRHYIYLKKKKKKKNSYLPTLWFFQGSPETKVFFFWSHAELYESIFKTICITVLP